MRAECARFEPETGLAQARGKIGLQAMQGLRNPAHAEVGDMVVAPASGHIEGKLESWRPHGIGRNPQIRHTLRRDIADECQRRMQRILAHQATAQTRMQLPRQRMQTRSRRNIRPEREKHPRCRGPAHFTSLC